MIAALADMARVDLSKPSAAAATIESKTAQMGVRVASRTIENHLKRIPEALALQLPSVEFSESMGNHDSNVVDAGSVD